MLKDQSIRVLGLEQDAVAWDTVGLTMLLAMGHWPCDCSGLSSETSPELATQLPQAPCYIESGTKLLLEPRDFSPPLRVVAE